MSQATFTSISTCQNNTPVTGKYTESISTTSSENITFAAVILFVQGKAQKQHQYLAREESVQYSGDLKMADFMRFTKILNKLSLMTAKKKYL